MTDHDVPYLDPCRPKVNGQHLSGFFGGFDLLGPVVEIFRVQAPKSFFSDNGLLLAELGLFHRAFRDPHW